MVVTDLTTVRKQWFSTTHNILEFNVLWNWNQISGWSIVSIECQIVVFHRGFGTERWACEHSICYYAIAWWKGRQVYRQLCCVRRQFCKSNANYFGLITLATITHRHRLMHSQLPKFQLDAILMICRASFMHVNTLASHQIGQLRDKASVSHCLWPIQSEFITHWCSIFCYEVNDRRLNIYMWRMKRTHTI